MTPLPRLNRQRLRETEAYLQKRLSRKPPEKPQPPKSAVREFVKAFRRGQNP